jgi:integrase/recombinase XerD
MATATIQIAQNTQVTRPTIGQQFLAGQLSQATARAYRSDVEDFFGMPCEALTPEHLRAVTAADVIDWRNARMAEQSPATVARKVSSLRSLFRHAKAVGMIDESPIQREVVRSPRVSQESGTEGLTRDEARALLDAITGDGLTALRDRAMVTMMLYTGLRRAEVVSVDLADLSTEQGHTVLTVTGKGGKVRKAVLRAEVLRELDVYLQARTDDSPALFVNHARNGHDGQRLSDKAVARRIERYAAAAGIAKHITAHSLRHSFATAAIDGGAPVHRLQYAMGHAEPRTTMRYYRNAENLDDHASRYVTF